MDHFVTLDLGTTAVKVAIIDATGKIVALSIQEYALSTPAEDIVELDPAVYWESCRKGMADVLSRARGEIAIKSIGACSQGETLIALDTNGRPLRNAIVWMDNRSKKEADLLRAKFGAEATQEITGQPDMIPTWPITKIMWLRDHEPRVFKRVRKFLLVEDYIIHRLTGRFVGEYALYTSSCMLDIVRKRWWEDILNFVGVSPELLVDLHESGQIVGNVTSSAGAELGISEGTPVVSGAMDQTAGMIGAGNIAPGVVTETTGAALAVCATVASFPKGRKGSIAVQYHAIPNEYLLLGWCATGGMALRWLRDTFFAAHGSDSYDLLTSWAKDVPPGSDGLVFLPYLAGAGTPVVNADARGAFVGIDLHHGRAHFVRAVLESIAFVLRQNVEEMERLGVSCKEIRSLGGGSKSALWNQIKADVLVKPVITMQSSEATSLGMAALQAAAAGTYPSLRAAVEKMVRPASRIDPEKDGVTAYETAYRRFLQAAGEKREHA